MGDQDDTLGKGADILRLEVVKGGKPDDPEIQDSCSETLEQIDDVREQIISGRLTSMILFAITTDGEYTRLILSKNRFELIGLASEMSALVQEDVVYKSNSD